MTSWHTPADLERPPDAEILVQFDEFVETMGLKGDKLEKMLSMDINQKWNLLKQRINYSEVIIRRAIYNEWWVKFRWELKRAECGEKSGPDTTSLGFEVERRANRKEPTHSQNVSQLWNGTIS